MGGKMEIILKLISRKQVITVWAEFMWLRVKSKAGWGGGVL
jgi:hypothetical protein